MAYRRDGADSIEYDVKNTTLTCDILFDSLDVSVVGDSIRVKAFFDYSNAKRCYCATGFSFRVKTDGAFLGAKVIVFDHGNGDTPDVIPVVETDRAAANSQASVPGDDVRRLTDAAGERELLIPRV